MFLLDTNVISELRRARPHGGVVAWLRGIDQNDLFVSVVTICEIQIGIERTRATDAVRAAELEAWLEQVIASHRMLDMNVAAFREAARLIQKLPLALMPDAMIAATAAVHGLTVVTRNARDFALLGVVCLNPFSPG